MRKKHTDGSIRMQKMRKCAVKMRSQKTYPIFAKIPLIPVSTKEELRLERKARAWAAALASMVGG